MTQELNDTSFASSSLQQQTSKKDSGSMQLTHGYENSAMNMYAVTYLLCEFGSKDSTILTFFIQEDTQILWTLQFNNKLFIPARIRRVAHQFWFCLTEVMAIRIDLYRDKQVCWQTKQSRRIMKIPIERKALVSLIIKTGTKSPTSPLDMVLRRQNTRNGLGHPEQVLVLYIKWECH